MKNWKPYAIIILLSLLPLVHMFLTSGIPHTSDGTMHAIRFAAYYKEFISGQIPVRWAGQFLYGYGTAIFNFVYPLPYIVSIPFVASGLPLGFILKLSFALTYILASIFMYLFSEKLFKSSKGAFLVAVMYQFAPFRLVEMNTRGTLGTLYAYALVPLLFYAILRIKEKINYKSILLLSISVMLLCLSHTIIGFAFIGLAILFILFTFNDKYAALTMLLSTVAGIGLAAFFVLPAIVEQHYTNGYLFTKNVFYDHFPQLYKLLLPNFTNAQQLRVAEVAVSIGLFHLLSLLGLVYLLFRKRLKNEPMRISIFIVLVTILTVIFMQPVSRPIWENISFIRQFQFPWRFLGIITFTTSLASYFLFTQYKILQKPKIYFLLITFIILTTFYYWKPPQGYIYESEKNLWNYPLSTNYFSEVNTVWMAAEAGSYPKQRVEIASGNAGIINKKFSSTTHTYIIDARSKATVLDRTYYFPGWRLSIDGKNAMIQFQDSRFPGLISYDIEPGTHMIVLQFVQSRIQKLGDLISIITGMGFILYMPFRKVSSRLAARKSHS